MISRENLKDMDWTEIELVVMEALLRRISLVDMPFALKGNPVNETIFGESGYSVCFVFGENHRCQSSL
ncbi:hypothetical protein [Thermoactinomyces sp. CICC 10523]|uniref:hypothetical protein n=1 Tax=Thermoactinomyces sp. CICC 10523 TaxID=2767428 RepID=UPI001E3D4342|nr:hypothetical protein [Thermoactinomyces sp. CICC 10523]